MSIDYARWEKYLLYTILKRTIRRYDFVEIAAQFFNCHPSTYNDNEHLCDGLSSNFYDADGLEIFDGKEKIVETLEKSISNPLVCKALVEDFGCMDTAHRCVVEKFLVNPLFCDAILSFSGFASSAILQSLGSTRYQIDTLLDAFNARALSFFCVQLDPLDVKCFLDICGNALGLSEDATYPLEFHGWTFYMTTWALIRGQCSFWNFEDASLIDILLNIMPAHIKLPILFTCWLFG